MSITTRLTHGAGATVLVLLILAALPACRRSSEQPASQPASISIEAVSPRGEVAWPFTFEWKTNVPPQTVCRVTIYDIAERQLLQVDQKGSRLPAPADLEKFLPASRRFLWKASVLNDNGAEIAQSSLTEFTVR